MTGRQFGGAPEIGKGFIAKERLIPVSSESRSSSALSFWYQGFPSIDFYGLDYANNVTRDKPEVKTKGLITYFKVVSILAFKVRPDGSALSEPSTSLVTTKYYSDGTGIVGVQLTDGW